MRVTHYFALSVVIACGTVLPLLTGCGGATNDSSTSTTPIVTASPATGATRAYAGQWEGSWDVTDVSGVSITGPATFVITENGTFTATLQNSTSNTQGVFTKNTTRTVTGTIQSSGFFTGTITVDNVTDTVSGSLSTIIGSTGRLRGTLSVTHSGVQSSGTVDISTVD